MLEKVLLCLRFYLDATFAVQLPKRLFSLFTGVANKICSAMLGTAFFTAMQRCRLPWGHQACEVERISFHANVKGIIKAVG